MSNVVGCDGFITLWIVALLTALVDGFGLN